MARTIIRKKYSGNMEDAKKKVETILSQNGFHEKTIKTGEIVWKKGTGMMTAMQYIKTEFLEGELVLSGWVQAGLGSVGLSEMELTGFVAAIPKKSTMKVINQIQNSL